MRPMIGSARKRRYVLSTASDFKLRHYLAAVEQVFNAGLFERLGGRGLGAASNRPIIIVGMPRSGTTLVEQIISAHPDVHGAGELDILQHMIGEATGIGGSRFPEWAAGMNEADLKLIGEACLAALPAGLPGQSRTTLKRLENFEYLGLLHLCLPNATLIHCRRDARDSSFSAFTTLFLEKQDYSYTFEELARYWRAYDRLMGRWSRVLPIGRVLEVSYEGLVADLEGWTRRLLAHCRLEWDDACLRYYESKRVVRSASFAQVRQPIFTTSIGRWKPFARQLAPLFAAMGL
ncbi:MAG TPA: sulfotransferase [Caulobacteraceae bacterium]|nr:sulfotransferase [Caulobacteraceae bacterium]